MVNGFVEALRMKFPAGDRPKTSGTRVVIVEESVRQRVKCGMRLTHFERRVVLRLSVDLDPREPGRLTEVWGK